MAETLRESLTAAAEVGIIASGQVEPLAAFVEARAARTASGAADVPNQEEDSEIPRFIRGYHDILITIGIVVVLIGLGGLATIYAAVAAIVVLAEIFVYRQRLALPSFALTIAFAICAGWMIVNLDRDYVSGEMSALSASSPHLAALAAAECVALALFYWRYRVPVAFAALTIAAVVTVTGLALSGLNGGGDFSLYGNTLLLISGLVLVVIAIRFDMLDPKRIYARSDIAFWLYLVAVPAILKGIFGSVRPQTTDGAALVIAVVALMMLLGLLLDRRAFVTAGLVYLGYAFAALIGRNTGLLGGIATSNTVLWILVAIGLIVLTVGFGWRFFRQHLLSGLPMPLRARLPILR
ncbi:hypothetical protein SAMN05421890_3489 [Ensifer adhaerens]|nr:hypothetical protein SAMN05421890_3489 [Ensifer adhaerens]